MTRKRRIILSIMFAVYYAVFAVSPLEYASRQTGSDLSAQAQKGVRESYRLFVVDLLLSNIHRHDGGVGKTNFLFRKRREVAQSRFENTKSRLVLPRAIPRVLAQSGFDVADDPEHTGIAEDLADPPEARLTYAAEEAAPKARSGYKQDHSGLSPPIA